MAWRAGERRQAGPGPAEEGGCALHALRFLPATAAPPGSPCPVAGGVGASGPGRPRAREACSVLK